MFRFLNSDDFAEVPYNAYHELRISRDAYRSMTALSEEYDKLAEAGKFVHGTNYHSVVYHEIGHMVSSVYGIDGYGIMREVLGFKSKPEVLEYCIEHLSVYSAVKQGEEIISECFSAYYGLDNPPQFVVDFIGKMMYTINTRG